MLNLIKKDLKLWFTGKRIGLFLLGVLIIIVISTSWHGQSNDTDATFISIGVVDLDDSEYSRLMLSYFEESDIFTEYATIVTGSEEEIHRKFMSGELTAYLVVPPNFAQNLIDIQNIPMKAYISTEDTTRAIILKNMLLAYEKYISAVEINCVSLYEVMKDAGMSYELRQKVNVDISMDLVFTALGKTSFFEFKELNNISRIPVTTYYGFEILFLFLTYLAMIAGMDMLKERRQGVLIRLKSTGVRMSLIVLEKQLFYTGMMAVLAIVLYAVIMIRNLTVPLDLILFLILYFTLASSFFMLISAFFTKLPTFLLISNVMILFGAVLGGGLIPIIYLPPSMKELAKTMVNFWFLNLSSSMFMKETTLLPSMIVALLAVILLFLTMTSFFVQRKEGMQREDV